MAKNRQQASNTFSGGLNLDFDIMLVEDNAYVLSENGRILYSDQGSISWTNAKGNIAAVTFNPEVPGSYFPLGYTVINNLFIVFLVNDTETIGEIGLITFDENGIQNSYNTLMSDNSFSEKFDFKKSNLIEARGVYENDECIRVYWCDGVEDDSNPPRAFTFKYDGGGINIANFYSAVTLSPHSVDQQAEFLMGIIKFIKSISGSIPAGQYLYSYRLITADGYATPWYPPTRPLFVTQDGINSTNWNEYEMEGTETFVNSGKGNRIEIKGIDERYQEIEVAYVHYIADGSPFESNVFVRTGITSDIMTFDHVSNSGDPIDPLEIPAQRVSFTGVKTINIKDNVQYEGNVNERFLRLTDAEQEDLLSNLTIEPKFRLMRSDEVELETTNPPPADDSVATFVEDPITHQVPKNGLSTKRLNQLHTEDYVIDNDYINYKGTQVSHIFEGMFRGEVYRLGIVLFDLIGNPSFAYHLADLTFDDQYGDTINWSRLRADGTIQTGSFTYGDTFRTTSDGTEAEDPVLNGENGADALARLRILGVDISGIDITNIKDKISGFMITRAERDKQILGQGLIMPCGKEGSYTVPLPTPSQRWVAASTLLPIPNSEAGDPLFLNSSLQSESFYHLEKDTAASETNDKVYLRPNTSTMYMPDIDFDIARYPTPQSVDRIKLVGQCSQKEMPGEPTWPKIRQYMHYNNYVVQKCDYTAGTFHYTADAPYPRLGDDASIVDMRLADYGGTSGGKIENYQGSLDFYNSCGLRAGNDSNSDPHAFYLDDDVNKRDIYAHGKNRTMFIFHNNFGIAGAPLAYEDTSGYGLTTYFIANYKRPNASPYGGLNSSSIEQTIFVSTGHFQPVNNPTIPDPNIVNDIEVFGGDCYLDYFGFARLYGLLLDKDFQGNGVYSDYGLGTLFPLESEIHHSLRQATNIGSGNPMWPDIGLQPATAFFGDDTTTNRIQNGLFLSWDYEGNDYGQTAVADSNVEEFNISGVLFLEAVLKVFFGLFQRFKSIDKFPTRWRYSQPKVYGELVDQFRIFLANDFHDLKGTYGQITSSEYIFDQIYSFQMRAFGRLRAFDRAALATQNLGNLYTGLGDALDGIDYISTINGNQHQWSLCNSGKALYWVDVFQRNIMRFAQDGSLSISDARKVNSFVNDFAPLLDLEDNPILGKGIRSIFDFENGEVIFSFVNDSPGVNRKTNHIIYNEATNVFVDTPVFDINHSFRFKNFVYFFQDGFNNNLWLHNSGDRGKYMGTIEESKISVVINNMASLSKVFDTIRMNINSNVVNLLDRIEMETPDQSFIISSIPTDNRFKYLEQILRGPLRTYDQPNRMRGKWIKLTFVFDNNIDERIIFTNLLTNFRPSNRF